MADNTIGRATYSPEDNKLRIYPDERLEREVYERVRAAGFSWAPKQELFVAPAWSPEREDLAAELCGEVEDEDTSLAERAEQRADRFEDYSDRRGSEADAAHAAVKSVCDGIPLGQPILVGHHSEKRARRDAERIETGMRTALRLFDCADYWKRRAAGVLRAAKYRERPDVRARRIKGLEADIRKQQRNEDELRKWQRFWRGEFTLTNRETGEKRPLAIVEENRAEIVQYLGSMPGGHFYLPRKDGDREDFKQSPDAYAALNGSYPTLYAPRTVEEAREACLAQIERSLDRCARWLAHYRNRLDYEKALLEQAGGTAADKTGPRKGGAVRCWASPRMGWSWIQKVNRVSVTILDNWGNGGGNFNRTIPFDKLAAVMSPEQVEEARAAGRLIELEDGRGFILADVVRQPAEKNPEPAPAPAPEDKTKVEQLRAAVAAGVQVKAVRNLFPTPPDLARRMVELAAIQPGETVLEPSAGTGNLLRAVYESGTQPGEVVAVEIERDLEPGLLNITKRVVITDFMQFDGGGIPFDVVVMNPPFENGADMRHIEHAWSLLRENGGRLVALCAAGPRQIERYAHIADRWEILPAGTFADEGTRVNVALLMLHR